MPTPRVYHWFCTPFACTSLITKAVFLRRGLSRFASSLLLVVSSAAIAAEIPVADDAQVRSDNPNFNYGGGTSLRIATSSPQRQAYLKFDVAGLLPLGTTSQDVSRAILRIYSTSVNTSGSVAVYSVTAPWIEGKADGTAGSGGNITWNSKPTTGNQEGAFPVATGVSGQENDYISLDVTDLVKAWLSTPSSNNGIALVASGPVDVTFDSKESSSTSHIPTIDVSLITSRVAPRGDVSMGVFTNGPRP